LGKAARLPDATIGIDRLPAKRAIIAIVRGFLDMLTFDGASAA